MFNWKNRLYRGKTAFFYIMVHIRFDWNIPSSILETSLTKTGTSLNLLINTENWVLPVLMDIDFKREFRVCTNMFYWNIQKNTWNLFDQIWHFVKLVIKYWKLSSTMQFLMDVVIISTTPYKAFSLSWYGCNGHQISLTALLQPPLGRGDGGCVNIGPI